MSTAGRLATPVIFGFAALLGAAMLFLIQPILGKGLTPRLGGTPAVWSTNPRGSRMCSP